MSFPPPFSLHAETRGSALPRAGAGDLTRERLLEVGSRLFAEQGYAKTSIRQIAHAAGTNVASVSYYFGNKAGLYQAACGCVADPSNPAAASPIADLDDFFVRMLAPLRSERQGRLRVKLLRREMLEPSGLWQAQVEGGLCPLHGALVALLCDRLGLATPDDAVHALALLVVAPALHLLLNCELIDRIAPRLLVDDSAIDAWCGRLHRNAELLIADEARSRGAPAPPVLPRSPA